MRKRRKEPVRSRRRSGRRSEDALVFRQFRLYLVDIGDNSTFEIIQIVESEFFLQFADGFGATAAYFAMHDDFFVGRDTVAVIGNGRQRDQFGADVDDIVFVGFACTSIS